jgi:hypothetical protein
MTPAAGQRPPSCQCPVASARLPVPGCQRPPPILGSLAPARSPSRSLEDDHVVCPERVQQLLAEVKGGEGRDQTARSLIHARILRERRRAFQQTHTYENSLTVPLPDDSRGSCQWRLTLCPEYGQHHLGQAECFHAKPVGRRLLTTSRSIAPRCHINSVPAWAARLIVGTTGIDAGFPPLTMPGPSREAAASRWPAR